MNALRATRSPEGLSLMWCRARACVFVTCTW